MSEPKRGSVAGQAIVTQAQTQEYDEGYDRIFGKDRKPERGTFIWCPKAQAMVPVGEEWVETDSERMPVFTDRYMEGVKALDGTDISSRSKRREYMKSRNLADADDFKGVWAKAKAEREAFYTPGAGHDKQRRRDALERAYYEATQRSKRK